MLVECKTHGDVALSDLHAGLYDLGPESLFSRDSQRRVFLKHPVARRISLKVRNSSVGLHHLVQKCLTVA